MPLDSSTLEDGFLSLANRASKGAMDITLDGAFADVILKYLAGLQYPPPAGVGPGINILRSDLSAITTCTGVVLPTILSAAMVKVGAQIAGAVPIGGSGILPTTPPVGAPNFAPIFASPQPAEKFASSMAVAIDAWIRTGIYDAFGTPAGPTPGPSPWQ